MYAGLSHAAVRGVVMGICENVYRRGAVYWWRCRFGPSEGGAAGRVLALSLRTRDPCSARSLGARLNAEAEMARSALRHGEGRGVAAVRMALMEAARELVRRDRIETPDGHVFHVDEAVLAAAEASAAEREAERPRGRLTAEVERGILRVIGRDAASRLHRKVDMLRSDLTFDAWGGQEDSFASAIEEDRGLAEVCRSLALRGSSARIEAGRRAELSTLGFSEAMVDRISDQLQDHARREQYGSWTIGPTYEQTAGLLSRAGIEPSKHNLARLRRNTLFLLAHILDDVERRYEQPFSQVAAVYADILEDDNSPSSVQHRSRLSDSGVRGVTCETGAGAHDTAASVTAATSVPSMANAPADKTGHRPSLLHLTEDLILTKTKGKSSDWEPKTANQHRSIAKLLIKVAGTDDPRRIDQTHIGKYFSTLAAMPKNYGKSSKDESRSIEEILARSDSLDDEEIGLEAGTVNRHQTQLGNILDHLKGNGFSCGEAFSSFRRPDAEASDQKRNPFTVADGQSLFASPVYMGHKSEESRGIPGNVIIHDALYWIPLIAWYGLMRLSEIAGLMLADIDFQAKAFIIRDNEIRRIKTPQSKRRVPFHPELIRLGFLDYISEVDNLGYRYVFPDLRLRGENTPMGALFYKIFKPVLDAALPHAVSQRITLHSTRKTGNTAMIAGKVIDPTRHQVMGHKMAGVNGKHYTASLPDDVLLEALMHLPLVTQSIHRSTIRLKSGLSQRSSYVSSDQNA